MAADEPAATWQRATLLEEGEMCQSLFAVLRQRLAAAELEHWTSSGTFAPLKAYFFELLESDRNEIAVSHPGVVAIVPIRN